MIRIPQVRVIDENGNQLGVMRTDEALRLAQERGFDLVEVAPMAVPPVTRLLDYGHFKYEQARKEKEARRHQRSVEFKEIRLKPKIGKGDFDTKVRRAIEFLEDGDRVKVAVQFRGRELSHAYIGRDLLTKFGELIREHGTVERQPLLEGKSMSIVVASSHKPKPQQHAPQAEAQPQSRGNGAAAAQASPEAEPAEPAEPAEATPTAETPPAPAPTNEPSPRPSGGGRPVEGRGRTDQTEPVSATGPGG